MNFKFEPLISENVVWVQNGVFTVPLQSILFCDTCCPDLKISHIPQNIEIL